MTGQQKKLAQCGSFLDVKFLDDSKAVCKLCNIYVSCGNAKDRTFSTSALYMHMQSRHGAELRRAETE